VPKVDGRADHRRFNHVLRIGDEMQACTLAIDVGGSAVKVAYGLADGRLEESRSITITDIRARGELISGIVEAIRVAADSAPPHLDVRSVGLVVPGNVDEAAGIGRHSIILGWRDIPFGRLVTEATALPVRVGHDVSAGALAEGWLGAARGHTEWLFLALGTGLGSAFVLGGVPYRGFNGYGGELSHVVALPDGPTCRCGKRGCLEMLASASAVVDRYVEASGTPEPISAAEVARRVLKGDEVAVAVWEQAVSALAVVVAGYVESMNPSAVVVGGGLAESGGLLLDPLRERLYAQIHFADRPVVHPAALGASAGACGAALLGLSAAGIALTTPAPEPVRASSGADA
jgi:glucokinase